MTREEAIRILDPETTIEALAVIEYYAGFSGHTAKVQACNEACEIAVAAMRELEALESHLKALETNEPLTIEELRQMDGEPVYVVDTLGADSQWCVLSVSEHFPGEGAAYIAGCECYWFDFKYYGEKWTAYRRKPEESLASDKKQATEKTSDKPRTIPVRDLYDEDGQEVRR